MTTAIKDEAAGQAPAAPRRRRIAGLDVAKALAMFFVISIHFHYYARGVPDTALSNALASLYVFCVPIFFAVNGALLLDRPLDIRRHYLKLLGIVLVTEVWRLVHIAFYRLASEAPALAPKQVLLALVGEVPDGYLLGHFWFMDALIAIYLVFPLLKYLYDAQGGKAARFCVLLVLVLACGVSNLEVLCQMLERLTGLHVTDMPAALGKYSVFGTYGYLVAYFMGGALVCKAALRGDGLHGRAARVALAGVVLGAVLTMLVQRFQHATGGAAFNVAGDYRLFSTAMLTFGLLYLLVAAFSASGSGVLCRLGAAIGSNTFGVYMLHMMLIMLFVGGQDAGLLASGESLPAAAVLACDYVAIACILAVATLLSMLLRRVPGVRALFRL